MYVGEELKEKSAIDRLNRLEELGLVESRADWEALRQIRNSLAHEYEDAGETSLADLNRIYENACTLLPFIKKFRVFTGADRKKEALWSQANRFRT